jgi:hypothetical protein
MYISSQDMFDASTDYRFQLNGKPDRSPAILPSSGGMKPDTSPNNTRSRMHTLKSAMSVDNIDAMSQQQRPDLSPGTNRISYTQSGGAVGRAKQEAVGKGASNTMQKNSSTVSMFDLAQQVAAKANGATKTFNTSSLE